MKKTTTNLQKATRKAYKQGLITIYGTERDTGIARSTVRRILRGEGDPTPATENLMWRYLQERGAV